MEAFLRAAAIYFGLLVLFRIAGKRTLAEATTFDFVLLLIIAEATQQGLLGDDFSLTNALLVVTSLIALDILMSLLQSRIPRLSRVVDGLPLVLVEDGHVYEDRLRRERVELEEILLEARRQQGLAAMDQIRYVVLERSGGISIVPREEAAAGS